MKRCGRNCNETSSLQNMVWTVPQRCGIKTRSPAEGSRNYALSKVQAVGDSAQKVLNLSDLEKIYQLKLENFHTKLMDEMKKKCREAMRLVKEKRYCENSIFKNNEYNTVIIIFCRTLGGLRDAYENKSMANVLNLLTRLILLRMKAVGNWF